MKSQHPLFSLVGVLLASLLLPAMAPAQTSKPATTTKPAVKKSDSEVQLAASKTRYAKQFIRMLSRLDSDADNKLSLKELGRNMGKVSSLDLDGNGILTKKEYIEARMKADAEQQASAPAPRSGASLRNPKGLEDSAKRYLKAHDKNQDGKLSKEEAGDVLAKAKDRNGDGLIDESELVAYWLERSAPEQIGLLFQDHDANKDGKLTPQEAPELFRDYSGADLNRDGVLIAEELHLALVTRKGQNLRVEDEVKLHTNLLDADADGQIAADEIAAANRRFPGIDADKDGIVTASEIKSALDAERALARELGPEASNYLRQFDKNGDRVIDRFEIPKGNGAMRGFDTDKDGLVTLHELNQGVTRRKKAQAGTGFNFTGFDLNRDGKITKEEQPKFFAALGAIIDKNKDGAISRKEFDSHFKNIRR